jgi:hypothetical protein
VKGKEIGLLARGARTWIGPHIGAVATVTPEPNVIAMGCAAVLKDQHQFVATSMEGPHAGLVLDSHADILQLAVDLAAGVKELTQVAPVDSDEVN